MNHDDERDYAEEAYNRALMQEEHESEEEITRLTTFPDPEVLTAVAVASGFLTGVALTVLVTRVVRHVRGPFDRILTVTQAPCAPSARKGIMGRE